MSYPAAVSKGRRWVCWLTVGVLIPIAALASFRVGGSISAERAPCRFPTGGSVAPLPATASPQATVELLVQAINEGKDASALFSRAGRSEDLVRAGLVRPSWVGNICSINVTDYAPDPQEESDHDGNSVSNVGIRFYWVLKAANNEQHPTLAAPEIPYGLIVQLIRRNPTDSWLIYAVGNG